MRERGYQFALFLLFPLLGALGLQWGGLWLFIPLIYGFILHPILDLVCGKVANPELSPGDEKVAEFLLVLTLPIYFALLLFALSRAHSFTPWQLYVAAYAIGLNGGVIGITAAHELVHRKERWQRGVGVALLSLVSYSHFRVEHVFGHHRWVATPRDPATARLGENIFAFWARSIFGSYTSAWRIERENVAKKNGSSMSNRMVHYTILQLVWMAAAWLLFGLPGLLFFVIQSAAAIWLLETINFVEHYGLVRKELEGGRYEPVAPKHSWDTNFALTNLSLFNLGMHARHHESAAVPFEKLRAEPGAPALPAGYSGMLLLAMVPPLWRAVMDPRVAKARAA